ncbi:hypothetical protein Fmac_008206 [Flemingia macrophylla]|uniref:Uncharacterized protein n=1 Tax=Flemingia macrophylla TaxID=520843 RepID=A0ABD1MWT5_9FABA
MPPPLSPSHSNPCNAPALRRLLLLLGLSLKPYFNDTATVDAALNPSTLPFDSAKKKRSGPKKYSPDGNIALGLTPGPGPDPTLAPSPTHATPSSSIEPLAKKHRGRPLASGRSKWTLSVCSPFLFHSHRYFLYSFFLGIGGTGFTPHLFLICACVGTSMGSGRRKKTEIKYFSSAPHRVLHGDAGVGCYLWCCRGEGLRGENKVQTLQGGANFFAPGYTKGDGLGAEIVGTFVLVYTFSHCPMDLLGGTLFRFKSK